MTETKFTPGPYKQYFDFEIVDEKCRIVATICDVDFDEDTQKANGALLGAAPDLYEALEEAVAIIEKHTYPCPDKPETAWQRAQTFKQTLSRARGENNE